MRKINLNIDYKRNKAEVDKMSNLELSEDYISYAVRRVYKEGLDVQFRRLWARLQRKLDETLDKKTGWIVLEEGEYEFIKRAIKEAPFVSDLSKYVVVLEDALDEAKEIEEKAEKTNDSKKSKS